MNCSGTLQPVACEESLVVGLNSNNDYKAFQLIVGLVPCGP